MGAGLLCQHQLLLAVLWLAEPTPCSAGSPAWLSRGFHPAWEVGWQQQDEGRTWHYGAPWEQAW